MKKKFTIFVVLLAGIIYTGHAQGVQWIYQQKQEKKNMKNLSEIYFAGGCFWGTDHFHETDQRSKIDSGRICQRKHC